MKSGKQRTSVTADFLKNLVFSRELNDTGENGVKPVVSTKMAY